MMMQLGADATAFGRVLTALMEARGLSPTWGEITALADRAGLEGSSFAARVADAEAEPPGSLRGLVDELGLDEREMMRLARAYALECEAG